jgi:hypothetical protein
LRGAAAKVFPHRGQNFIAPVGDESHAQKLARRRRAAKAPGLFIGRAKIAVSRGLGHHRPAGINTRTDDLALIDRALDRENRTAHVAN